MSVTAAGCVGCGGTLLLQENERLLDCPWCGIPLLIHAPEHIPRHVLPNTLTVADVRRHVRDALSRVEIPPEACQAGARARPQLYWVPFHELDARLIVRSILKMNSWDGMRYSADGMPRYTDNTGMPITAVEYQQRKSTANYDTRVRLHEVYEINPATELAGWGLENLNLRKMRIGGLQAVPYDPVALQVEGLVVTPDRSREELLQMSEKGRILGLQSWQTEQQAELCEKRIHLLYCPIWRMRYSFSGRHYTMTVSGLDGTILAGNAPENHVRGLMAMLLAGASVGLPASVLIKLIAMGGDGLFSLTALIGEGLVLLILLSGLALSWSEFRFRGELHFGADGASVVRIKLPAKTPIASFIDIYAAFLRWCLSQLDGSRRTK